MGGLFGSEKEISVNFFVDFENAQPSAGEKSVYDQIQPVVGNHPKIVTQMAGYKGNGKLHSSLYLYRSMESLI